MAIPSFILQAFELEEGRNDQKKLDEQQFCFCKRILLYFGIYGIATHAALLIGKAGQRSPLKQVPDIEQNSICRHRGVHRQPNDRKS